MQIQPLSSVTENLKEDESIRLSIILSRLEAGDSTVLITPIGKRVGPDELFESWKRIFDKNSSRINKVLFEIESSQMEKYGPRSIAKPYSEVKEQLLTTYSSSQQPCDHIEDVPPYIDIVVCYTYKS